ncbi:MAG: 5-amino-6-(5-phosphoribosylamino)uracil reductase [Micromonosporaceae bacterium]|nr:5-amino-6-(5-phosphoribosylamino)uracil reductase [Micromonosporaceae bacterium]
MHRPHTLLSCAISVDGYLDDSSPERLILSGEADLDRVDEVRAGVDAILVGANTVRRDDPRLVLRSQARQAARAERGLAPDPAKVTITRSGDLDPAARFFTLGEAPKLVYAASGAAEKLDARLAGRAAVIDAGADPELAWIVGDLARRGVERLMVEGGGGILSWFLSAGLADELHLTVAPRLVGDADAPRWLRPGSAPAGSLTLLETRRVGDCVLMRYAVTERPADREWLTRAIALSRRCPPSRTAFSVGAVLVAADGSEIAAGWSRESDPIEHAEEAALRKVDPEDSRLPGATLYSSLEPCGARASRPRPCAELTVAAGVRRVVYALREPARFVDGTGDERLRQAGVEVVEIADLADAARDVNAHLLPSD